MKDRAGFEAEMALAEAARLSGNEGRARVCARRAAGMVARSYLEQRGLTLISHSAYEQLRQLATLEGLPADVPQVIEHFLLKVDDRYQLPSEIDLIADAHWLGENLGVF